jgi:hypothetical protein
MIHKPKLLESYIKKEIFLESKLNEVAKSFYDAFLFHRIFDKFLSRSLPSSTNLIEKMKNLSTIDGNSVFIPYDEIVDLINFTLYVESEVKQNTINESKEYKISKFTEIVGSDFEEEIFQNNESTYSQNEVMNFILETTKTCTNNVKVVDKNIIILF